ncbi:uncharacterized protein LOC129046709 [Molothrus ater]|uniref:uncharacterized protein LOC129046709 n=1 Tax=Molothrus ater TaxID=84834 RepID=UPI0023E7B337|nr:uncharacterized protein LOC129046709 [Molothrus ater]
MPPHPGPGGTKPGAGICQAASRRQPRAVSSGERDARLTICLPPGRRGSPPFCQPPQFKRFPRRRQNFSISSGALRGFKASPTILRSQRSGLSLAGQRRTPRLTGSAEPPAGQPAGSFPSLLPAAPPPAPRSGGARLPPRTGRGRWMSGGGQGRDGRQEPPRAAGCRQQNPRMTEATTNTREEQAQGEERAREKSFAGTSLLRGTCWHCWACRTACTPKFKLQSITSDGFESLCQKPLEDSTNARWR